MRFVPILLVIACLVAECAIAQSPAADTAPPESTSTQSEQQAPSTGTLVAEPPGAENAEPAPAVERHALPGAWNEWLDTFLDVRVTDVVIALFAALLALFTIRLWSVTSGLWENMKRIAEDNRRAVEASERAAEAAQRSADEAEKSVSSLQDTAARHTRAYVTVKQLLQGPVKDEKQTLHGWVFQVVWQNTGATPTAGFRYWAMLNQFEPRIPDDFDFAAPPLKDFAAGELGANSTVTSGTLYLTQQEISRIQAGTRKAYIYGEAQYGDFLEQAAKRVTKFCVELVLVNDPGGANAVPFTFTYHAKHNSVT
jgi:hypothetical protein